MQDARPKLHDPMNMDEHWFAHEDSRIDEAIQCGVLQRIRTYRMNNISE